MSLDCISYTGLSPYFAPLPKGFYYTSIRIPEIASFPTLCPTTLYQQGLAPFTDPVIKLIISEPEH